MCVPAVAMVVMCRCGKFLSSNYPSLLHARAFELHGIELPQLTRPRIQVSLVP